MAVVKHIPQLFRIHVSLMSHHANFAQFRYKKAGDLSPAVSNKFMLIFLAYTCLAYQYSLGLHCQGNNNHKQGTIDDYLLYGGQCHS